MQLPCACNLLNCKGWFDLLGIIWALILGSSSAVKAGSCSNQIQPKVLESRLKHVSAQLDAQICYPPVELYKEFLDLL